MRGEWPAAHMLCATGCFLYDPQIVHLRRQVSRLKLVFFRATHLPSLPSIHRGLRSGPLACRPTLALPGSPDTGWQACVPQCRDAGRSCHRSVANSLLGSVGFEGLHGLIHTTMRCFYFVHQLFISTVSVMPV